MRNDTRHLISSPANAARLNRATACLERRTGAKPPFKASGSLKALLLLCGLLTASACTTTRYVTVRCLTPEQYERLKQAEPEKVGPKLSGQAQDDLKIIAGSAIELRSYGHGLLGVLEGCAGEAD